MDKMGSEQPMKVLAFGAGAIGTYIGGSLALDGHYVTFVERPQVAELVRQHGMRISVGGHLREVPADRYIVLPALDDAISHDSFDVALFALKSFDTADFLETLRPLVANLPPILCLSNGVENEQMISEVLGPQKVIAGTVTTAIGRRAAGDIVVEKLRGLGVASGNPVSDRLANAMSQAGLNAELFSKPQDMKWSKMLTNLLANASSAILNMTPVEIFANPRLCHLEVMQLREALTVMSKLSIGVVDLPRTPVKLLAMSVRLPVWLARPFLAKAVGSGRGAKMPSFHIDLYAGRGRSEVDYLNGAVVRRGEKLGLPTPVNRKLNEILLALTCKDISIDSYDHKPEKLLEEIRQI